MRTNRFFTLFITLLFLAEFLSPSFIQVTIPISEFDHPYQIDTIKHSGFQLTLFSEQLTENEEERVNHKSNFLATGLIDHSTYSNHNYTPSSVNYSTYKTHQIFSSKARLFRLYCAFLI